MGYSNIHTTLYRKNIKNNLIDTFQNLIIKMINDSRMHPP